ncbi:glycosyltransferase [Sediminibacillus massiliensis]|uniref:glycosyltransferase n=1 Tax=Sediminibacillus massiliensis TaxID=1926277 RepID=UPI001FE252DC|nr:glycosyltransferase [Sediminibacillus massiliensis]
MPESRRVLILSTMYPGRKNKTFGIFVENQVEALRERGWKTDVAAIRNPRNDKVHLLKKYLIWFLQIAYILMRKGRNYSIIHAHYIFPSGWFGLLFKRLFRAKLIVTSHGGDLDKMAKKGSFFVKRTKLVLDQADHVIAVGEKLKQEIVLKFSIPEEKVTVLNMGVNRHIFHPQPKTEAKEMLGISPDKKVILYVGNIIKAKGLKELVEAYRRLALTRSDLELHMIGAVKEPEFYRDLKKKVQTGNIKNIIFHQAKGQTEIARWMAAAEVFVLPSHMEGFGLVALEAMSCHTPVVGSRTGGLEYLLEDGAGILVEPQNDTSLQQGLEQVLDNTQLQEQLKAQGERKAQDNDQYRLLDQLISIYQR